MNDEFNIDCSIYGRAIGKSQIITNYKKLEKEIQSLKEQLGRERECVDYLSSGCRNLEEAEHVVISMQKKAVKDWVLRMIKRARETQKMRGKVE